MCLKSYYNQELELDLLSEIKKVGLREWNQKVEEEKHKIQVKTAAFKKH